MAKEHIIELGAEYAPGLEILGGVLNKPLLLKPEIVSTLVGNVAEYRQKVFAGTFEDKITSLFSSVNNGVAVIQISGIICNKGNVFALFWGFCPVEFIKGLIEKHLADAGIKRIILQIDSPGGMVDGVENLSDFIFGARDQKEIFAVASPLAASAAYWIGSAASKFYLESNTAAGGSIGVIAIHHDISEANKARGLKITEITSAKYKAVTSSNAPLGEEGRAELTRQVLKVHDVFKKQVARNRGRAEADVADDGRLYLGVEAIANGLFDGLSTVDDLLLLEAKTMADNADITKPATAQGTAPAGSTDKPENQGNSAPELSAAWLKENRPAVYTEIVESVRADHRAEGALAERVRVAGIMEATPKGFEAMAKEAILGGKVTPADFKVEVAEKIIENGVTLDQLEGESTDADFTGTSDDAGEITGKTLSGWIAKGMQPAAKR